MPNASGTHPLPALAPSGEELWQQEGRMPHCLREGVLFLISIPRALSPERNKALAPHWTEHMAALHTAEGRTLWWLKAWGRELLLRGEMAQKKKGAHYILRKRRSHLCFITRRDSGSPGQPFPKRSPLSCLPFPGCKQPLLFCGGRDLFCGSLAPHSQAEVLEYPGNPSNRSLSTIPFTGTGGGKARSWENTHRPVHARR